MGKRAAQSAATQQSKVPKVEATPEDRLAQELAPVLKHLNQAALNELQSVAPFCLKTAEGRHAFQESMVNSIEAALKGIQAQHQGAMTSAEEQLAAVCAKQDQNVTRREEADAKVAQTTEVHQSKVETQGTIEAEAMKASDALKGAQEQEEELAGNKAATLKENEAFEKFLVTFEALKNGSYAGKEWRERNKAIDETLKVVDISDASLKASLPNALRTKPAERGRFSLKAVHFCEVALASRGEKLKEKIGSFDPEAAALAQKSQEAQEALKLIEDKLTAAKAETDAAKAELDACVKEKASIEKEMKGAPAEAQEALKLIEDKLTAAKAETDAAKAELDACVKEKASIEKEMKGAPAAAQKSQKAWEKAKEQLSQSEAVLSKFDELKNRTFPEAPKDVASAESAPAEVTTQE
eukprot:Skav218154  [mRNA]  locus=scaffold4591:9309:11473:+ [translate_table: standard]